MQKNKYPYSLVDLQLFTEGAEGASTEAAEADTAETGENGNTQQDPVKTFTQEEVDNIVKGRIAKEKKNWEKKLQDDQTEAQKLASMSETQKKKYQEEKRLKDLDDREAAITRRELTAQAKDQLADNGLPIELAEVLVYTDAESCKESIETVSKAFQKALEKGIEERIKGGRTMKKASSNPDDDLSNQIYKYMTGK